MLVNVSSAVGLMSGRSARELVGNGSVAVSDGVAYYQYYRGLPARPRGVCCPSMFVLFLQTKKIF